MSVQQLIVVHPGMQPQTCDDIVAMTGAVSYSVEKRDPEATRAIIERIPETAIVQDADRLDAIGAIGIARCFTYNGAKGAAGLDTAIAHFEDKLLRLESMMKTQSGRRMAAQRSSRVRQFMVWWQQEGGPAPAHA